MNSVWQERKENVFARGMGNIFPIVAERAKNAEVWDVEGRRYIVFAGGLGGNVIRILAPLTIPFEQVDEGLGILRNAFRLAFE